MRNHLHSQWVQKRDSKRDSQGRRRSRRILQQRRVISSEECKAESSPLRREFENPSLMINEKKRLPVKGAEKMGESSTKWVRIKIDNLTYCGEDWPWHGERREEPLVSNAIVAPCPVSGSKSVLNHCEDSELTPSPETVNEQSKVQLLSLPIRAIELIISRYINIYNIFLAIRFRIFS